MAKLNGPFNITGCFSDLPAYILPGINRTVMRRKGKVSQTKRTTSLRSPASFVFERFLYKIDRLLTNSGYSLPVAVFSFIKILQCAFFVITEIYLCHLHDDFVGAGAFIFKTKKDFMNTINRREHGACITFIHFMIASKSIFGDAFGSSFSPPVLQPVDLQT